MEQLPILLPAGGDGSVFPEEPCRAWLRRETEVSVLAETREGRKGSSAC